MSLTNGNWYDTIDVRLRGQDFQIDSGGYIDTGVSLALDLTPFSRAEIFMGVGPDGLQIFLRDAGSDMVVPILNDGKAVFFSDDTPFKFWETVRTAWGTWDKSKGLHQPAMELIANEAFSISYLNPDFSGLHEVKIYNPYFWMDIDPAEAIWTLLGLYTDGESTAEIRERIFTLHRDSLVNYSALMGDYLTAVRMTFSRKIGKSIGEMIAEIIVQSGAMVAFSGETGGKDANGATVDDAANSSLSLVHLKGIPDSGLTYDLDDPESFITEGSSVKAEGLDYLSRVEVTWGDHVFTGGSGNQYPVQPADGENVLKIIDETKEALAGERSADVKADFIQYRQFADAGRETGLYSLTSRRVTLTHGPLHWEYGAAEIIHFTSEEHGLDGSEDFLVIQKVPDLRYNGAIAFIECVEISDPSNFEAISPTHSRLIDRILWRMDANSGITKDGSDRVSLWDSANGFLDVFADASGSAQPLWLSADKNGLDVIEFASNVMWLRTEGVPFERYSRGWTCAMAVYIDDITAQTSMVDGMILEMDSAGATTPFARGLGYSRPSGAASSVAFKYQHLQDFSTSEQHLSAADITKGWQVLIFSGSYSDWDKETTLHGRILMKEFTDLPIDAAEDRDFTFPTLSATKTLMSIGARGRTVPGLTPFAGKIGEMIFYEGCLTPSELRGVDKYLRDRWAI